ncbi:MAG: hypothetical protein U0931_07000 [Vulcanimicrobiota bacterium]
MASGINFNPASRQVGNQTNIQRAAGPKEQAQSFNDGFQASGGVPAPDAQPVATTPGQVELKVSREELLSQGFQQTVATLASAGIQVAVTVIASGNARPSSSGNEVTRNEFNQLQNQVNQQGSQLNTLQSQYGNIAGSYHKPSPPTYGGD